MPALEPVLLAAGDPRGSPHR